jgi:hypothetical protein
MASLYFLEYQKRNDMDMYRFSYRFVIEYHNNGVEIPVYMKLIVINFCVSVTK